jgi:hypothetical protein
VAVELPRPAVSEGPISFTDADPSPTPKGLFVGYARPFINNDPGQPIRLFRYSDDEREFGGIYLSGAIDAAVAHAVNQFFPEWRIQDRASFIRGLGAPLPSSDPAASVHQFFNNGGRDCYVVGIDTTRRRRTSSCAASPNLTRRHERRWSRRSRVGHTGYRIGKIWRSSSWRSS